MIFNLISIKSNASILSYNKITKKTYKLIVMSSKSTKNLTNKIHPFQRIENGPKLHAFLFTSQDKLWATKWTAPIWLTQLWCSDIASATPMELATKATPRSPCV